MFPKIAISDNKANARRLGIGRPGQIGFGKTELIYTIDTGELARRQSINARPTEEYLDRNIAGNIGSLYSAIDPLIRGVSNVRERVVRVNSVDGMILGYTRDPFRPALSSSACLLPIVYRAICARERVTRDRLPGFTAILRP